MLTPREIAEAAVRTLDAKMAKDIKLLCTTEQTVLADYFVICTATSSTHVKTLTDEMREFYNLEHLWSDAEEISLSALPGPTV